MFQCLEHTLGMESRDWKVLAKCHQRRNAAEYEGYLEADEQLVTDLTRITYMLLEKVSAMGPVS